ncbi:hypothetical protein BE15_32360 [Sorangium cellulosum]|uniref:Uncharacterized protein n=1 Tax=Sorangium cellulosum TaxID=56 RepID=A0A150QYK4_SORCE|nr:hypothetical protein BE15_32360 [Sorangium cellulosum]
MCDERADRPELAEQGAHRVARAAEHLAHELRGRPSRSLEAPACPFQSTRVARQDQNSKIS